MRLQIVAFLVFSVLGTVVSYNETVWLMNMLYEELGHPQNVDRLSLFSECAVVSGVASALLLGSLHLVNKYDRQITQCMCFLTCPLRYMCFVMREGRFGPIHI